MKDLKKSSTLYFPKDFEENQKIDQDLKDGITLSPVLNILLDREYEYPGNK